MQSARHTNAARRARQKGKNNNRKGLAEILLKTIREYRQVITTVAQHESARNSRGHPQMSKSTLVNREATEKAMGLEEWSAGQCDCR